LETVVLGSLESTDHGVVHNVSDGASVVRGLTGWHIDAS
jgi:hypothetical protein